MTQPLLRIDNLSIAFSKQDETRTVVSDLTLQIQRGETLALVGESGSGKSVSALSILRLLPSPPVSYPQGDILFHGRSLLHADEQTLRGIRGNKIAMIFQEPMTSLNPILRCGKQIAESLRLHRGMKKKEAMDEAIRMMQAVGIANPAVRAYEYPHQMSGGMRQRVMIAMALACQPQILIADEPTTALDVTIQAQILDLIRHLNETMKTSVVFITHDLGVVSELCDTVIVMYTGHIVEQAPVREIFDNPLHPYTQGLLSAIPKITRERNPLSTIEGMVPNPTDKITGCSFWPRCPYATERCKQEEPPVFSAGENRKVRCWRYDNLNETTGGSDND